MKLNIAWLLCLILSITLRLSGCPLAGEILFDVSLVLCGAATYRDYYTRVDCDA